MWYYLFDSLAEDFGIMVNPQKSLRTGTNSYVLTLAEGAYNYEESGPFNTENNKAVEETIATVEEEGSPVGVEESINTIDYAYINSLYDEKEKASSKTALESYAIDLYGIDLRKNQTFQDMVVELEDKLLN